MTRLRRRPGEHAQATVELALVLPVVVVLALAFVELALVVRDTVLCVHAAREAARAWAVGEDPVAAAHQRSGLGDELRVTVDEATGVTTVELPLAARLPLLGRVVGGASLRQQAVMRREAFPFPFPLARAGPVWK